VQPLLSPSARSAGLAAAVLLLLVTLPFASSAHKIDDPLYLAAARHVLAHPLDPLGGPSFWHEQPGTLFQDLYNPPLIAYLLALPVALDGGRELTVHVLMIALASLALLVCAAAGEAWDVPPRYTLLFAASPALAVSAVSAMTDVVFLLFCALAWGLARRGGVASPGLAAGLSALTKYVGLLNLPLVVLAAPRARRGLTAATIGACLFAAYCAWNVAADGALHIRAAGRFQELSLARQSTFAASFVASLGLVGLPAVFGLLRWSRSTALAAAVAAAAGLAYMQGRPGSTGLALVAFGSGGALLWAAGLATRRVRDPFLRVAFWVFAVYASVFVYFGTARYLLPALPPLLWLLVRGEGLVENPSPPRLFGSVAASAIVALVVLRADAGFADAWREAGGRLPRSARGFHTGRWGFFWYAGERGYQPLRPRERLRKGDMIAEPAGIHSVPPVPAQAALLVPRGLVRVASPSLRVLDGAAGAGLYSSFWGVLPLGWRRGATEQVALLTPDPDLLAALDRPVAGPVVVDLGSDQAPRVELDGWSALEAFTDEDGTRRTFVWGVGPESALRVPLPAGLQRITLRASPAPSAVGRLRIQIGQDAHAAVDLQPGWRSYVVPLVGSVPGGLTDVVLVPSGYESPGARAAERRELSVAVDVIGFQGPDVTPPPAR
jgi:hypothetical protein